MKNTFLKANNTRQVTMIFIVALLLFAFLLPSFNVAQAEETTWEKGYNEYINSLNNSDDKDWYLGENHLNVNGALSIIDDFLSDDNFNKEALLADPIIIAVVDSGIGHAYTMSEDTEVPVAPENVYNDGVEYKLHPVFDDVLLKDDQGEYVYANVAKEVSVRNENKYTIKTLEAIDSGNIACDLVDNTSNDHGTHVTGTIAMLIHMLGLEDYIKILPVKANVYLDKKTSGSNTNYYASYNINQLNDAMDFCLEKGADIVSLSLTAYKNNLGQINDGYMFDDYADDMLIVGAAGNSGALKEGYPAASNKILGVMNYTIADGSARLASSTNYGQWYEITAPGTNIISSINGDEYGKLTGTSMATPITAFASALGLFRHIGYNNYNFDARLTPQVLRTMLHFGASKNLNANGREYPLLNLTDVLTYDFYGDMDFLVEIGYAPSADVEITGIEVVTDAPNTFKIGRTDSGDLQIINLRARTLPSGSFTTDRIVWWREHDGVVDRIGMTWTIDYAIPDSVGTYKIWCTIEGADGVEYAVAQEPFVFEVEYRTLQELKIFSYNTEFVVDYPYEFILPTEYVENGADLEVVWYVNGEKVATGTTYVFRPTTEGDYTIEARVNGQVIDQKHITVGPDQSILAGIVFLLLMGVAGFAIQSLYIALLVKFLLELIVGIVVLIINAVRKNKKKKENLSA